MELKTTQMINTEVLVIGGGAAGLRAAIEAKKYSLAVALISESPVGLRNNSAISKATFAAPGIWKGHGDSPEVYLRDTITAGHFLNDRRLVATLAYGASQQVYDMMKFGVNFEQRHGELLLGLTPGHTYPRHVSVEACKGINLTRPMQQYAASIDIQFIEGILVTKLLLAEDTVVGALGIDDKGQIFVVNAKCTILATGGAAQIYLRTNNARGLTGDGYALAYEVGATLRDMEFVQFYPTAWGKHGSKMCMYEAFLPKGATIRNSLAEDILKRYGMNDITSVTRDILTRTIMKEIADGRGIEGNVIFDFTTMPEEVIQKVSSRHLFGNRDFLGKLQVAPTTHFFMGGIRINENCETGIDGLYAAGEVCGGIHGANRLGGNAIIETLVFGRIAGDSAAARASKVNQILTPQRAIAGEVERLTELGSHNGRENLEQLQQLLKQNMWDKVGVIRNRQGIEDAQREIFALREQLRTISLADYRQLTQAIKLANMLTVSEMVCRAALTRTESRGAHYRTDYPDEDNEQWLKLIEISCQDGKMVLRVVPLTGDTVN